MTPDFGTAYKARRQAAECMRDAAGRLREATFNLSAFAYAQGSLHVDRAELRLAHGKLCESLERYHKLASALALEPK